MKDYNVVIVGAGPAGIFSALELAKAGLKDVLLVEQGKDISEREKLPPRGKNLVCGWGGAGAYSDGKLIFSTEIGGFLNEFIPKDELIEFLKEAEAIYLKFGAPSHVYGADSSTIESLQREAKLAGMELIPIRVRHIGTENCRKLLEGLREKLEKEIDILTGTYVKDIIEKDGTVKGVILETGEKISAKTVIIAAGRAGASWVKELTERFHMGSVPSPVDIGVRVEAPAAILTKLTDPLYEAKLIYYSKSFDDKIRTFCMNPYGEVVTEEVNGIITVNGHSYAFKKSENTNFAILVSSTFTRPFNNPIEYGKYISRLANFLGEGVIIQRLGDLLEGRRSTPERIARCITRPTLQTATPGDLSFVLPYRYLKDIIEMLEAMEKLTPGIFSRHTLLYGVEVKFYSHRVKVSSKLESEIKNLFIIGDGAGITRGLLQASASGIIAAREIITRITK